MTKEMIDDFIENNEEIKNRIKKISLKYKINDFILFSEKARDYIKNREETDCECLYGCIYDLREKYLRIDIDSVESRLRNEYMKFLSELLEIDDDIDIVFYIIGYHYLTLCKDIAFKMTIDSSAPFPFLAQEISPLAKKRLEQYNEISYGELHCLFDHFKEKDLVFFNSIFWDLQYHHHSTKHFSLIYYLIDMHIDVNQYSFDDSFSKLLDVFVDDV